MENKIFYKNWKWWYYLFVFALLTTFLLLGLYFCMFVDFWYVDKNTTYASFLNFDVLMSFLSVQVNIITIVWLIFMILRYSAKNNSFLKNEMQTIVMNWNFLVFVIFWIGIISAFASGEDKLSNYPDTQLACTAITHFGCQLLLLIVYCFETGNKKYFYFEIYKRKEIYLVILYPLLYLVFIFFRGAIFKRDGNFNYRWPYPFLDFDNLLFGNSVFLYTVLLIFVFIIWLFINHLILITLNNWIYDFKQKRKNISLTKKLGEKETTKIL